MACCSLDGGCHQGQSDRHQSHRQGHGEGVHFVAFVQAPQDAPLQRRDPGGRYAADNLRRGPFLALLGP
jgi:hypothetical protein